MKNESYTFIYKSGSNIHMNVKNRILATSEIEIISTAFMPLRQGLHKTIFSVK
jgi:hypothetical protein